MPLISKRRLLLFLLGGAAAAWAIWPSPGNINISSCEPKGTLASLSAYLFDKRFWRTQLEYVQSEIGAEEIAIAAMAKRRKTSEDSEAQVRAILERFYELNPGAVPSEAQRQAIRLRQKADQIEEEEARQGFIDWAKERTDHARRCEKEIRSRL